ncbi:MAG: serine/threonine protein kinase [Kofleriaceae bacterium]|nr:serine/threonine protein kinase [Kofleriaceae bacterium]
MSTVAHEDPRIGTVAGARYRITGVLGTGGMGSVYRAEDVTTGGEVALKILRSHLGASDEANARFRREAFVGSLIVHPNCVGVTALGQCEDGAIYLAMELLDGEALGDAMARAPRLPWRRALHVARHVLRGLAHAHDQAIVHRDIKPDNIFLTTRDGDADFARVLDFGIAKLVGGAAGPAITAAGLTVGTPDYLSPEQALGLELDGRTDLYSLSVVLFEMLTGTTPFADPELVKILTGHTSRPIPTFAEVAPDLVVPDAVERLVRDGMAKRPDDRIASAAAYVERIDALLAAPAADAGADALIGALLDDRYRVEALLGTGAWGRVYRATHVALRRAVAIKVLDAQVLADDEARRRFEREALATGRLRHPNCVAVTDVGALPDGSRYLAMELADGVNLADLLGDVPRLPVARAVHVMRHLLRGLGHAHGHGLVHRDLKPANIMLVAEGGDPDFVKILDFGLARMMAGDDRITRSGVACGTPRYMAPEQVLSRGFDARTDLYAASVTLFQMLTGHTPFEHDDVPTLLKMHLAAPVPRLADVVPGLQVPAALEALIARGLAKDPAERPASAARYLAELDAAVAPAGATIELSSLVPAITGAIATAAPPAPPPRPAPGARPAPPPIRRPGDDRCPARP